MAVIIAKNTSTLDIILEDLGVIIQGFSMINLTDTYELYEIIASDDLKTQVSIETIVINDGVNDLSKEYGLRHISIETEYEDLIQDTENIDGGSPYEVYLIDQIIDGGCP